MTLEDRHPADPPLSLTEEERRLLCPVCDDPEVQRGTHRSGALHRMNIERARAYAPIDVAAAVAILPLRRPDLLRETTSSLPPDDIVIDMPDEDDV